jgi:hypothetical protein
VPKSEDNQEERLARIEALMEEYRLKHEDLEAYLRNYREESREYLANAKVQLESARRQSGKKR